MNNHDKNTYVIKEIQKALLSLMKKKALKDISITEIVTKAQVGRASFYRNFKSKEDVLKQYDLSLIKAWGNQSESDPESNIHNVFGSLFDHYQNHRDFYLLLLKNNLTETILATILEVAGPKNEMSNSEAYGKSFIAYGIYGWVIEWMSRGMQESAQEINVLLDNQKKNEE